MKRRWWPNWREGRRDHGGECPHTGPAVHCLGNPDALPAALRAVERVHRATRFEAYADWATCQKARHEILWLDIEPTDLGDPLPTGWLALVEGLFASLYEAPDADQCDEIRLVGLGVRDGALDVAVRGASAMQFGMVQLARRLSVRTCAECGAPGRFDRIFKIPRCGRHGLAH